MSNSIFKGNHVLPVSCNQIQESVARRELDAKQRNHFEILSAFNCGLSQCTINIREKTYNMMNIEGLGEKLSPVMLLISIIVKMKATQNT